MLLDNATFRKKAEVYGKAYEIYIKRGVIAYLMEKKLIARDDVRLSDWQDHRMEVIYKDVVNALEITDPLECYKTKHQLNHLAICSILTGYTLTREYIKAIYPAFTKQRNPSLKLKALWCPLTLPNANTWDVSLIEKDREYLTKEFGIAFGKRADLFNKGRMGRADFILCMTHTKKNIDYVLVHEYSYELPPKSPNFTEQRSHLNELSRHRRLIDSRGVFANVYAEIEGEHFDISSEIYQHLTALAGRDKPFYKLCQACAYLDDFIAVNDIESQARVVKTRALAITLNGFESIGASYGNGIKDSRATLIKDLAEAYRNHRGINDDDEVAFADRVNKLFETLRKKLPRVLSDQFKTLKYDPKAQFSVGNSYEYPLKETIDTQPSEQHPSGVYVNTNKSFHIHQAIDYVGDDTAVNDYFGGNAKQSIYDIAVNQNKIKNEQITLRNLHASSVIAALQNTQSGKINLICLEGNPGIGKTTALKDYLGSNSAGFLFIYISPRVVINQDVSHSMANHEQGKSGILTITSNDRINKIANLYYQEKLKPLEANPRFISGAVIIDGVDEANIVKPMGDILVLNNEQLEEINTRFTDSNIHKMTASEHEDVVSDKTKTGVWRGIASTTNALLALNEAIDKVSITVAMQGYKPTPQGTTLDSFSKIFNESVRSSRSNPNPASILAERQKFAQRIPNIVVMIDELTGDGAGAPLVKDFIGWLNTEFIDPFTNMGRESPFKVSLVVADASLGNEVVMTKYLESGDENDEKVIISKTNHTAPFALSINRIKVAKRYYPAIHIMTNSFPSDSLELRYQVSFNNVEPRIVNNSLQTPQQAINEAKYETALEKACLEIQKSLAEGSKQTIYFAQDKGFLRDIANNLVADEDLALSRDKVAVIDGDVELTQRKKLLEPQRRDNTKVFLMTSSASRGVSFPKCDHIIVSVPRFDLESSLMEIAQLIYRGRGFYTNEYGEQISGDSGKKILTFLIEDYFVKNDEMAFDNKRRWVNQSIDIMTLIVMIRATVFTRITGGAGLRQSLSLVPVGKIGIEDISLKMSDSVATFIKKGNVALSDNLSKDNYGLLYNALQNVITLFMDFRIEGVSKQPHDNRTFTDLSLSNQLQTLVTHDRQTLLIPTNADIPLLPENIYSSGLTTIEDFGQLDLTESFNFTNLSLHNPQCMTDLLNQLYVIGQSNGEFNAELKDCATNLFKMLVRENNRSDFSVVKHLKNAKMWVAYPTDYNRFMQESHEPNSFVLEDGDSWHTLLSGEIGARTGVMPPIPIYKQQPYVAKSSNLNPLNFRQIFDDRYFAVSSTFNLLNTLLLNN